MKLRAPAYPLITVDPYFSLWSMADELNSDTVRHWTGKPNTVIGLVTVDGEEKVFMGLPRDKKAMKQVSADFSALSTEYVFEDESIRLTARFTSPLLPGDLKKMTRPVSYLELSYESTDGKEHEVSASLACSEELVMNVKGDDTVLCQLTDAGGIPAVKMGREHQQVLGRAGDDLRIEWGYFYLAVPGGKTSVCRDEDMTFVSGKVPLEEKKVGLFLLAYDDMVSLDYFGTPVKSLWNADGTTIEDAIFEAYCEHMGLRKACAEFSEKLYSDAERAGGSKYAELLSLAYRQVIAAHKCALDPDGNIIFVSKECFSNGCAATVDVSYPSIPMFLYYEPELVRGMMRPIYKFARSDAWQYDFAPHDAGRYPLVRGQVYARSIDEQMPVEECGNLLIMETACAIASGGDVSFAKDHWDTLELWVKYLEKYGEDPENQLCTDDFAGHLAHNCNLSIKAIMGIAGFAILNRLAGDEAAYEHYMEEAKSMGLSWAERASDGDGSFRLAFDQPGTFSMKYNAVWDKLWGTKIFPEDVIAAELASNFKHFNAYGMPLDNRADYTKSDWQVWTATLLGGKEDFERFIAPLWKAYDESPSRVPLTDWYYTSTALQQKFQNRTVQGGMFIKLLEKRAER